MTLWIQIRFNQSIAHQPINRGWLMKLDTVSKETIDWSRVIIMLQMYQNQLTCNRYLHNMGFLFNITIVIQFPAFPDSFISFGYPINCQCCLTIFSYIPMSPLGWTKILLLFRVTQHIIHGHPWSSSSLSVSKISQSSW